MTHDLPDRGTLILKDDTAVGSFVERYTATLSGLAPPSRYTCEQTARELAHHLGEATALCEIASADGEGFRDFLANKHMRSTTGLKLNMARAIFRAAVRQGHMASNPLDGVRVLGRRTKKVPSEIPRQEMERVLESCSPTWQIVFALGPIRWSKVSVGNVVF